MLEFIKIQNKINAWIIEKCWKPIKVKGSKLRGIFSRISVENFPLLEDDNEELYARIKLIRRIENTVSYEDMFLPWRPIPTL